jgi:hypothetical protein
VTAALALPAASANAPATEAACKSFMAGLLAS